MGARSRVSARWWGGSYARRPPYTYARAGDGDVVYTPIAPCATLLTPHAITEAELVEMRNKLADRAASAFWIPLGLYDDSVFWRIYKEGLREPSPWPYITNVPEDK